MSQKGLDLSRIATQILEILRGATKGMIEPVVFQIVDEYGRNPLFILISCILSLRTRDDVSLLASR